MAEGHDEALHDRRRGRKLLKPSFKDFGRRMRDSTARIVRKHRAVGLSSAGAVGAWGLALGYYLCKLTGRLLTVANPAIVQRHFPIR
jgi:hypothetical protein